jgi:hypothetical protein
MMIYEAVKIKVMYRALLLAKSVNFWEIRSLGKIIYVVEENVFFND